MIKHFESLWVDAEILSNQEMNNVSDIIKNVILEISSLESSINQEDSFGKILFNLCYLSQKLNINTYSALLKAIQNKKIDTIVEDED